MLIQRTQLRVDCTAQTSRAEAHLMHGMVGGRWGATGNVSALSTLCLTSSMLVKLAPWWTVISTHGKSLLIPL